MVYKFIEKTDDKQIIIVAFSYCFFLGVHR